MHTDAIAVPADLIELVPEHDLDSARLHRFVQRIADSAIERAQQTLAAYQQVHLAAQCPQHAGQLDRDVAGTDHRPLAWCPSTVEQPVHIDEIGSAACRERVWKAV